jgi:hypothetical protein
MEACALISKRSFIFSLLALRQIHTLVENGYHEAIAYWPAAGARSTRHADVCCAARTTYMMKNSYLISENTFC